jgi:uncharacterized membrane protein YcaP (DUF421 family)
MPELFACLFAAGDGIAQSMFRLPLPILEKMLRPIIVYVAIVILLRVFGKRELAQLNPFDLVVLLSVSNTVQNAIIGEDNSVTGGLIGAFTLFAVNYLVVRFLFKHRRLDEIIEGVPTVLIENGCVCPPAMAKELITTSELTSVAHRQGYASLDEIETCKLEPGGIFFFRAKTPPVAERQHKDVMARLDQLSIQIEDLRRGLAAG